ncbi:hypothetical protein B0H10DRAFT_2216403 [Mycena sp. CBHHK59/15]|nr:hypothetical protein B0H10DRAFT_2216403 [Mycena sp. CBHHK59/15]
MAYAKAFAKPISPMYAEKLLRGDFTVVPAHDQAQVEAYRMMNQRRLKTYWFHKDNVPPHTFDIDSLSANTGNLQLTSSADVEVTSLCSDDEDEAAPTQSSVPAGRYSKLKTMLGSPSCKPVRAWPLKWACQMDKGFRAMNQANGKVAKRFTEAFVGTNHARVESNGLTLENLNDILKIVTNKRSKSMSTTEAIEKLGQAGVKVDWVYVADREANDPKCQLENFTSLQLEIQTADTQTLPEPNSTNCKKAAKIPAIHTIQFNYEKEWEDAKVWQLIIFDPAVDTEPMRPKVIVVDYTDVAGNIVEMHHFNRLLLHLCEAAPTHLCTGQVASDDASTLSVGTSSLIDALFKNWKPVNFDAPFEMEYVLPGYSLDPIKMIEWANGINGPDDLKKAEWFLATPFYPLADKGEPEAPEEDGDAPPDAVWWSSHSHSNGPAAAQEKDAEKDAERRKSKNKFPHPVAILVDWITDVDEILRKHENGWVPAVAADDGKKSKTRTKRPMFTHKSFEALFGRRWAWLASCKEAADIIRDQQARLDGLARTKFDAFMGNMTCKVGIQTFMKLAENIGDDSEEEEEEEEDTTGEKGGEKNSDSDSDYPLGIATLPPIRLVMVVVYISDVQLIASVSPAIVKCVASNAAPSRCPADAVRTPPLASHHHHQPVWLVFTPKPSIHAQSQPVVVDTLNESGETDFRSCQYAHLDTNASTRSPTLLGAASLPRAKGSPGLRAFPRMPTRSRLNAPRLVPAHSRGLTRLPRPTLPPLFDAASTFATASSMAGFSSSLRCPPPAATHARPAPLERNESKSLLPSVSSPAPTPAFSTEVLQSACRSRMHAHTAHTPNRGRVHAHRPSLRLNPNTTPPIEGVFALITHPWLMHEPTLSHTHLHLRLPAPLPAPHIVGRGVHGRQHAPRAADCFAFLANASAEETTAHYLLHCLPDLRQLAVHLHAIHAEHHLGAAPLRRVYVLTNTWGWFVDSVRVELLKDGWMEVWGSGTLCSTRRQRSVIGRLASSRTPSCKRSEYRDEAFVLQLDFEPVHFCPFSGVKHLVISIPPLEPLATADITILVQAVIIIDIVWLLLEHSAMAPSSGGIVKLWTPQLHLYELDAAVLNEEAFANIFAIFNFQTHTRSGGLDLLALLNPIFSEPRWVQFLSDWLVYCLGGELVDWMPGDAIQQSRKLFLDVITIRVQNFGSQEGDALVLAMLLKAQMQNFRSYGQIPADFCWIDDLEQRETWDGDSDAGERDSDWEECSEDEEEDDLRDEDFPDPEYVAQDFLPHPSTSSEEPPDLVSFVQNPAKPAISVLPKKPRQAPSEDNQDELPGCWVAHIKIFFFTSEEE